MLSETVEKVCNTFDWIIFVVVSHSEARSQVPQANQNPDIEVNKDQEWDETWKCLSLTEVSVLVFLLFAENFS